MPFQRIVGDIFAQTIKACLISYNVIVKAALPQFRVGKDAGGARCVGRLALKRTNRVGQGGRGSGQLQQSVNVVRHSHELVKDNGAMSSGHLQPNVRDNLPEWAQHDLVLVDVAQKASTIRNAYRDEIVSWRAVIEIGQAKSLSDRTAAVLLFDGTHFIMVA
jgi:hypothetical protein